MNILVILIPMALGLGALGLAAFLWSLKNRQFEDIEGASWRVILDDSDLPDSTAPEKTPKA